MVRVWSPGLQGREGHVTDCFWIAFTMANPAQPTSTAQFGSSPQLSQQPLIRNGQQTAPTYPEKEVDPDLQLLKTDLDQVYRRHQERGSQRVESLEKELNQAREQIIRLETQVQAQQPVDKLPLSTSAPLTLFEAIGQKAHWESRAKAAEKQVLQHKDTAQNLYNNIALLERKGRED